MSLAHGVGLLERMHTRWKMQRKMLCVWRQKGRNNYCNRRAELQVKIGFTPTSFPFLAVWEELASRSVTDVRLQLLALTKTAVADWSVLIQCGFQ